MDSELASSYTIWDSRSAAGQAANLGIIVQDFAELTLAVRDTWCGVHWEITKVSRKLHEGMMFYTIPTEEVEDEDENLLHVGMCVLAQITLFLGHYAIIQLATLNLDGLQTQKPMFWIHTSLLHIPQSRLMDAQWAQTLFPGFIPSAIQITVPT